MRTRKMAIAVLTTLLTLCASTAVASPADAASSTKVCSDWTNEHVWQTTTAGGRVRERTCLEWIPNGNQIRARGEFQVDWPTNCSLSIGLPISGSAGCPASFYTKDKYVDFNSIQIHMQWRNAAGAWGEGSCNWKSQHARKGVTTPTATWSCSSPYQAHPAGTYVNWVDVTADVANDGDGYKTCEPIGKAWTWSGR
jgi:hypothetical protein